MSAFLRKYGVADHIYIPIVKRAVVDFAVGADWTPVAGDVKISVDGAAVANVTNLPTAIASGNGAFWDFSMTAAEQTGKKMTVTIVDSATKAIEDQAFDIETYGHASAQHPFDLGTALQDVNAAKVGGTTQTGRDLGLSVLLSAGVGTGQLDFASGVVKANLVQILATALTETAGQIAAAFKKLFDVASPVLTAQSVNQTGDAFARLGAPAGASTAADIAAAKADTAAIKTQTDKLTFTVANQVDVNVLDWKSAVAPAMTGDAFARLGAPAGASTAADIAAVLAKTPDAAHYTNARGDKLDNLSGDAYALLTSAQAEPVAVPAANASPIVKIGYTFAKMRNKRLTTATTDKVRNDADSADIATAALSDDGVTFTKGVDT